MTTTDIERLILDYANDDSYALSEIVARVRQADPRRPLAEARSIARKAVDGMINSGQLRAVWLERPGGPEEALDLKRAKAALADDLAWLAYNHWRPHVRLVAVMTDTG